MIGIVSIVLLAATLTGIWVLTEQSAEETSALSGSVAEAIEVGANGATAGSDASADNASADGVEMSSGATVGAAQVPDEPSAFSRFANEVAAWASLNVRRLAHTAEFAAVGLFASLAAECLGERWVRGRRRSIAAVAFCALCSLADQTHKLFVPGRHFDPVDLGFDAAGYLVACALVFAVARAVRAMRRSKGLGQGLEEG